MSIGIDLVFVVISLAMNAFFVIGEFSMVRVRPSQIDMALAEGKRGARAAKQITSNVNAYLAACQLGITLASLALGWLGEPAFTAVIRPLIEPLHLPDAAISSISVALGYILLTTLHVVIGEQIPKSFAIFSTERWMLRTAGVLIWFYRITYPIMWVFNKLTRSAVRLAGHDPDKEHEAYTDEEIKILIDESTESGLIGKAENEYMDNIFAIQDKDTEAIMTPRTDVICLDLQDDLEESLSVVRNYQFTRYPVCRGSKDHIEGFVHLKDLYAARENGIDSFDDIEIRPIVAVPEGLSVAKLLEHLQTHHSKIAVVVDEHGGTSGIVTMSDVIEQFVGRVEDEYTHSANEEVVKLDENKFLVDGSLSIDKVIELMGFEPPEAEKCETAGGLVLALLDRIPEKGDEARVCSHEEDDEEENTSPKKIAHFTITEMDNMRVDKMELQMSDEVGDEISNATSDESQKAPEEAQE